MHNSLTQMTFLGRLQASDASAWHDMDRVYKPMMRRWLGQFQLQPQEQEDLTQEVMLFVIGHVQDFEHSGNPGAFRNWLRQTTVNVTRNYLRKHRRLSAVGSTQLSTMVDALADPVSPLTMEFNLYHDQAVVHMLLDSVALHFKPESIAIFRSHVIEEQPTAAVASHHGVSAAVVHTTKFRVMKRLREQAHGWVDDLYL